MTNPEKNYLILQELIQLIKPQSMIEYPKPHSYFMMFYEQGYECCITFYPKTSRLKLRCDYFPTFAKMQELLTPIGKNYQLRLDF